MATTPDILSRLKDRADGAELLTRASGCNGPGEEAALLRDAACEIERLRGVVEAAARRLQAEPSSRLRVADWLIDALKG